MSEDSSGGAGMYSGEQYLTASSEYACARGTRGMLALSIPKGAILEGPLSVDLTCPCCGEAVVIQGRSHHVNEAGVLVSS